MDEGSAAGGPTACERSIGDGGANEKDKEAQEAGEDGLITSILSLGAKLTSSEVGAATTGG